MFYKYQYYRNSSEKLQPAVDHSDEKYQCKMSPCNYTGTNIINNIPWTGEQVEQEEAYHIEDQTEKDLDTTESGGMTGGEKEEKDQEVAVGLSFSEDAVSSHPRRSRGRGVMYRLKKIFRRK